VNAFVGQTAVFAVAMAVAGAAVFSGDRETFVPPPETVAEEFLRGVTTGRYEPARSRLSDDARGGGDAEDLASLRAVLESRVGRVSRVKGGRAEIDGNAAMAEVEITSASGSVRDVQVRLVRRHHLWFVAGLPRV